MGFALTSCNNSIDITRKLSEEDAAIVPYQEGQIVKFLNTIANDTLTMKVIDDDIKAMSRTEENEYTKFHVEYGPYSYCRYITLADDLNLFKMVFIVRPDSEFEFFFRDYDNNKDFSIVFDLEEIALTPSVTIDDVEYTDVYCKDINGGGKVIFSTEEGLELFRTTNGVSYRLIE